MSNEKLCLTVNIMKQDMENSKSQKIGSQEQIRIGLLELLGGSADLLVDSWISNHLRWIIWKLASFERCFPVLRGQYLTLSEEPKEIQNGEQAVEGRKGRGREI